MWLFCSFFVNTMIQCLIKRAFAEVCFESYEEISELRELQCLCKYPELSPYVCRYCFLKINYKKLWHKNFYIIFTGE